jgi:transcription-repair coupling factor (superfamily II helicase)
VQIDLCLLTHLIEEIPSYRELLARLKNPENKEIQALILNAGKPYLIAALFQKMQIPVMVITAQPEQAKLLYDQIACWSNTGEIYLFPEPDTLPYQRAIADVSIEQNRLQVLTELIGSSRKKGAPLVVASAPAVMQRLADAREFHSYCEAIGVGDIIDPLVLMRKLSSIGYQAEIMVEQPGSISRRGGILDIFPPDTDYPARLEFFGNTVESMRFFDTETQRSLKVITRLNITPASGILPLKDNTTLKKALGQLNLSVCNDETRQQFEQEILLLSSGQKLANQGFYAPFFNNSAIFEYLPENTLFILDNPLRIQDEVKYITDESEEIRQSKIQSRDLPDNFPRPYLSWPQIEEYIKTRQKLSLTSWEGSENPGHLHMDFIPASSYAGQLKTLIDKTRIYLTQNKRLILVSNQADRISELFESQNIFTQPLTEIKTIPQDGTLTLIRGSLSEGWTMGHTCLLTDREIFGFVKERNLLKRRQVKRHKLLVDIKPGDYVVHVEHGIGQFIEVNMMTTSDTQKEYLVLSYANGDKLYVPTDQIDRVNRYIGAGEGAPTLSRLGTQEWNHTKQKVQNEVSEIAEDLLNLYAAREVVQGFSFSPDTVWQREMEAAFPYIETPDQIKVQEEVKADMARSKPMDRLIVGDVGYGKTEIAVRAAFKAVMDNKQVAVLVPTTVLAEQHFLTFKQRMGAFPVSIEVLSRFRSAKDQKKVIAGLSDGTVDICIGTHRLLQKDVVFKDLGLLVIDEEQRFGVSHKEHLKKLREQVDVLTLSATPIPRTLHMSLVGVRDMSLIETPPENRLPIRTYVAEYSDQLIKESIIRELERNGQVFFVHNRVLGISAVAEKIQKLVPDARIEVAHGQMPEEQLEKVMHNFQQGASNILVCTTIIESGLDLPNVNTLIVNQADRFGLTQLYQLRGRIGRGSNTAYAYFLYDRNRQLAPVAEKRLQTIFEAADLGAGYSIAMKDLELRGAGSLLSIRQSGNISAVGFNLYTELLAQAVEERKAKRSELKKVIHSVKRPDPSIDLPLKAFIPDDYITDIDMRLSIYQKLTGLTSLDGVEDLARELLDRFGPLPIEVQNLLYVLRLKAASLRNGIDSIATNDGLVTIRLLPGLFVNRQKMLPMYRYSPKVGLSQISVNIKRLGKDWQKIVEEFINCV